MPRQKHVFRLARQPNAEDYARVATVNDPLDVSGRDGVLEFINDRSKR
jgi:hypothetical protein